jgi:ABC-2 type transport system permease protein
VTGLIRSEFRKLFSTQVWIWLLLGTVGLTALAVVGTILGDGAQGNPTPRLTTPEGQRNLFASGTAGAIFVCILGIIGITAEYRHLTVTPTYLVTPKRGRVVAAKLAVYGILGLGYAIVSEIVLIAMAVPWLGAKNIDYSLTSNGVPRVLFAGIIVTIIYGVLGVGTGALIRNQIAAVTLTLAYLFIIENLISALPGVKAAYKYLPGGALNAVTSMFSNNNTLLAPWQGGLLLVGYAVVFAVAATRLTVNRDVT